MRNNDELKELKVPEIRKELEYNLANMVNLGARENKPLSTLKTIELSIDNNLIYTSGYDVEHIVVLNLHSLQFLEYLKCHTDCIFCIASDANKNILVAGGRDKKVSFWKVRKYKKKKKLTHEFITEFTECKDYVLSIKISKFSNKIFALFQNNIIYEFDSDEFKVKNQYRSFYNYFNDSYFTVSGHGTKLIGSLGPDNKVFQSLTINSKKICYNFYSTETQCSAFDYLPKNDINLIGNYNGNTYAKNEKNGKFMLVKREPSAGIINISHNSKENLFFISQREDSILIFGINKQRKVSMLNKIKTGIMMSIESIEVSYDDKKLVAGGSNHLIVFSLNS
jgi:WD40 repeat protein